MTPLCPVFTQYDKATCIQQSLGQTDAAAANGATMDVSAFNTPIGGTWNPVNFCSAADTSNQWVTCPCNGEFVGGQASGGTCEYNVNNPGHELACINNPGTCCGSVGQVLTCTRSGYNANATDCCIDNVLQGAGNVLSQGSGAETVTCDPNYRTPADPAGGCFPLLQSYCADADNLELWNSSTPNNTCQQYYQLVSNYGNTTQQGQMLSAVLPTVTSTYPFKSGVLGGGLTPEGVAMWKTMTGLCSGPNMYGPCDDGLSAACANLTYKDVTDAGVDMFTQSDTADASAVIVAACGCHLPSQEYSKYPGIVPEGVGHSCDSACILSGAITQDGTTCPAGICILSDVSINIINSNESGGVNLDMVCPQSAGSGVTRCYMSDINVNEINSSVKGGINLVEQCPGGCFTADNPPVAVPCSPGGPGAAKVISIAPAASAIDNITTWMKEHTTTVIVIVVIAVVLFVLILWWRSYSDAPAPALDQGLTLKDLYGPSDY